MLVSPKLFFEDFTTPPAKSVIDAAKLEKICKGEVLGHVIQINMVQKTEEDTSEQDIDLDIQVVLDQF
jgi:hypothetical protein